MAAYDPKKFAAPHCSFSLRPSLTQVEGEMRTTRSRLIALLALAAPAIAQQPADVLRIWADEALEDWATPIAALGIRPGHFTAAEYYAASADNLRTYRVYRPDREPGPAPRVKDS